MFLRWLKVNRVDPFEDVGKIGCQFRGTRLGGDMTIGLGVSNHDFPKV